MSDAMRIATMFIAMLWQLSAAFVFGDESAIPQLPFEWQTFGIVEDASGNPIPDAIVRTAGSDAFVQTRTNRQGRYSLSFRTENPAGWPLLVTDSEGRKSSVPRWRFGERILQRVVLKPANKLNVRVLNESDEPVADATVSAFAGIVVDSVTTDDRGEAVLQIPYNANLKTITALCDHNGFDYYHLKGSQTVALPERLIFKLNGAITATVRVVDSMEKPIMGASVRPLRVSRKGRGTYALVATDSGLARTTDASGTAQFNWVPDDLISDLAFRVSCAGYLTNRRVEIDRIRPEVTATLTQFAVAKGRALMEDGSPVAGAQIEGMGLSRRLSHRSYAITGADGSYSISIAPDTQTSLTLTAANAAATTVPNITLKEGEHLEEVNFKATPGTAITGIITLGNQSRPAAGLTVHISQLHRAAGITSARWTQTNRRGQYSFRVTEGEYMLSLPTSPGQAARPRIQIFVDDQKEIIHNLQIESAARADLSGSVVGRDGAAVPQAIIFGESISEPKHSGFRIRADAAGKFSVNRWSDEMFVYCLDAKSGWASLQTIEAETEQSDIQLKPAAELQGLVSDDNGKPLPGFRIQLTVLLTPKILGGPRIQLYGQSDESGRYSIRGIVPGMKCVLYAQKNGQMSTIPSFQIEATGIVKAADLVVQSPSAVGEQIND